MFNMLRSNKPQLRIIVVTNLYLLNAQRIAFRFEVIEARVNSVEPQTKPFILFLFLFFYLNAGGGGSVSHNNNLIVQINSNNNSNEYKSILMTREVKREREGEREKI